MSRLQTYTRYWSWQAALLLAALAAAIVGYKLLFPGGIDVYAWLHEHQQSVIGWVGANTLAAAAVFLIIFVLGVAVSLPVAGTLIVLSGFLFGIVAGTALSVAGASLGATAFLYLAQTALGDRLRPHPEQQDPEGLWQRLMRGLRRDASHYLLAIRLVPVLPFFLVNIACALLGMRVRTFFPITFFGMIPSTAVIAALGAGLGTILSRGERPDFSVLYEPPILLPLLGMALLVLLPVFYRRWIARHPEQ